MTRRRTRRPLGRSLEEDSTARRIYGREVIELATLLDLSAEWTSDHLATALCLCVGYDTRDEIDHFTARLRWPLPTRGPFSSFLLESRGIELGADRVAWDLVDWASTQAERRLVALGLLLGPLDLGMADVLRIYDSLRDAASSAPPLRLVGGVRGMSRPAHHQMAFLSRSSALNRSVRGQRGICLVSSRVWPPSTLAILL